MSEIVTVVARLRAKAGQESRTREVLTGLVAPTRAEAGCLNYDLHQSFDDPQDFLFYENWASAAHLDAHLRSPHLKAAFKIAPEILEWAPEIYRCRKLS